MNRLELRAVLAEIFEKDIAFKNADFSEAEQNFGKIWKALSEELPLLTDIIMEKLESEKEITDRDPDKEYNVMHTVNGPVILHKIF